MRRTFESPSPCQHHQKGSILILVIWLVVMISIFTLSVGGMARQRLKSIGMLEDRARIRRVADAGVQRALQIIQTKPLDKGPVIDRLNEQWSTNPAYFKDIEIDGGTFSVVKLWPIDEKLDESTKNFLYGVVDEESKINLNLYDEPAVLRRAFAAAAKISQEKASQLAESILDWRDEDEHSYPDGAESRYYKTLSPPYVAKNKNIETLEELLFVKGMTPGLLKKIEPYVSIYGGQQVNLNTASSVALTGLGMAPSIIDKMIEYRRGRDGKEGTFDDNVFSSIEAAPSELNEVIGLSDGEMNEFTRRLSKGQTSVSSHYFTIRSVGRLNNRTRTYMITCVVERGGGIKSWHEGFVES
ncbi:MAG: general secretion pathway protein GspK [Candidatus Omnitrophica bacterium]|nr:general secretion pathway protein GspK [Candidatus Omnitrophota bacterium]